jgi:hypothetical protein
MTRRTRRNRQLIMGAVFSAAWSIPLWQSVFNNRVFLSIYDGKELTQSVVLLLIAGGFTVQAFCLTAGAWMARLRARQPEAARTQSRLTI